MRERPILFSGAMVNAILSGAKTQTRRVRGLESINENPSDWAVVRRMEKVEQNIDGTTQEFPGADDNSWLALKDERGIADYGYGCFSCLYGKVGDRLWVREAFSEILPNALFAEKVFYRADGVPDTFFFSGKWKPSIFMPRSASRITLEITGVRVERLNKITSRDAIAEGILPIGIEHSPDIPINEFHELWDKINGKKHPWAINPWVWVVEFKRIETEQK